MQEAVIDIQWKEQRESDLGDLGVGETVNNQGSNIQESPHHNYSYMYIIYANFFLTYVQTFTWMKDGCGMLTRTFCQ